MMNNLTPEGLLLIAKGLSYVMGNPSVTLTDFDRAETKPFIKKNGRRKI